MNEIEENLILTLKFQIRKQKALEEARAREEITEEEKRKEEEKIDDEKDDLEEDIVVTHL